MARSVRWLLVFLGAALFTACRGVELDPEPECGNGRLERDEECDDGNDDQTDLCLTTCLLATCGDGLVFSTLEECDDGAANADTAACRTDCTNQSCGDGDIGPDEACDDGNDVDTDACRNDCALPGCNDGLQSDTEACDDGNPDTGDGCTPTCQLEVGWEWDAEGGHCAPGHEGASCGTCSPGYQDVDANGTCLPTCALFDALGGCSVGTDCDLVAGAPTCVASCPVHVVLGDTTAGDGTSWGSPMGDLQAAIDLAEDRAVDRPDGRCGVWVQEGTQVVYDASVGDTIRLAPGVDVYGGFAGTESDPSERERAVDSELMTHETVLDGDGQCRHVVTGASNASIDGIVITGGYAPGDRNAPEGRGAGLYAVDAIGLELRSMVFRNNHAITGGGAFALGGSWLVVDSRFEGNEAGYDGGAIGAIDTTELEIQGTWFDSNMSTNGWGGALFHRGNGLLWIEGTTFNVNSARWDGGAVWHAGSGVVTVVDSAFTDTNQVEGPNGSGCLGGAMFIRGFDEADVQKGWADEPGDLGTLSIVGTRFTGNRVPWEGGALYLKHIVNADFYGNVFEANEAINRDSLGNALTYGGIGGAVVGYDVCDITFSETQFVANESGGTGGGMALFTSHSLRASSTTFDSNKALRGQGGGLYAKGLTDPSGFTDVDFTENTSTVDGGGAFIDGIASLDIQGGSFVDNAVSGSGGMGAGLFLRGHFDTSTATIDGTPFEGNDINGSGAGLAARFLESLDITDATFRDNGNGASTGSGSGLHAAYVADLTIEETLFEENGLHRSHGPSALFVGNSKQLTVRDTTVQDHTGTSGFGAMFVCNDKSAILTSPSCSGTSLNSSQDPAVPSGNYEMAVSIQDSTFDGNAAGPSGAAHLWAKSIDDLTISGSVFLEGTSSVGGAIWSEGGREVSIFDTQFEGNTGQGLGSAVTMNHVTGDYDHSLLIDGCSFEDHKPSPPVRTEQIELVTISDSEFANFEVSGVSGCNGSPAPAVSYALLGEGKGGAVHIQQAYDVTVEGTDFTGFQASSGGALAIDAGTVDAGVVVRDSTFTGNYATDAGGALFVYGGATATLEDLTFSGSASCKAGGALNVEYFDEVNLTGSSFEDYGSYNDSGAAHITNNDSVTLEDVTFSGSTDRNLVGGALLIENGKSSFIHDVVLDGVTVAGSSSSTTGGGAKIANAESVTVVDSLFEGNVCDVQGINTTSSPAWCLGTGLFVGPAGEVVVERTAFLGNSAESDGNNEGQIGAGFAADSVQVLTVRASVFGDNVVVANGTTTNSIAGNRGAGLVFRPALWPGRLGGTALTIEGSTFSGNLANDATAISIDDDHAFVSDNDVDILNSIVRGPNGVVQRWMHNNQVERQYLSPGLIRFGDVQGYANGTYNVIDVNPAFQAPSGTDPYQKFRLSASSTAVIHTGTTLGSDTVDFDGVTRAAPPSMGAFEYIP